MSLNFCVDLLFGGVIFSHALQDRFEREIIKKHNIKKTHSHSFHNNLLGELITIWRFNRNSAGADVVLRAIITLTKNFGVKTSTE